MAERAPPVLDAAILCAEVVRDGSGAVFALNEPLNTAVLQADAEGRLPVAELVLFVQMTDWEAQGSYTFTVEVRSNTGGVIAGSHDSEVSVTFASRYYPFSPFEHVFVVRGLMFPGPGVCHFHVLCGLASMSARDVCARPAKLTVVRAEPGEQPV